jgi:hypothetical protein
MKKYKSHLAEFIYNMLYFIDKKLGKVDDYGYETAPYCGHHYSGHRGYFTASSYHEGMGGCKAEFGSVWIFKNTEESTWKMGFNKNNKK